MRYSFRLAELVGHKPDPRRRPGTIKQIVEYTGLDRHQVAALLKNEVKYIPLHALSRICDFLIETGRVSPDQLPGALFAVEPEHFWELLARRKRLDLVAGVRQENESHYSFDGAWVVASDAVLMGELLNGVTTLGGTARHRIEGAMTEEATMAALGAPVRPPHPELLRQSLVWSPGPAGNERVMQRAREVYRGFVETAEDKALVCLGSTKSNPVVELILAEAFGCTAFESQDNLGSASRRSCPFYMRYRDHDPHPPSCCGGLNLGTKSATKPGIYYELPNGNWQCCPWSPDHEDAAFVFYVHRESQGELEMALGGFSGRATRLLAKMLSSRAELFWPASFRGQGLQIGAFIVKFQLSSDERTDQDLLRTDLTAGTEVIPLSSEVIEKRLRPETLEQLAAAKPR